MTLRWSRAFTSAPIRWRERILNYLQAAVLGVVEGVTEFLPVSSTGHLTVTEKLFNLKIDDKSITAFTAVIQFGAIIAVLIYFWRDIWRLIVAGVMAIRDPARRSEPAAREAGFVVIGTIPIAIVGIAAKNAIEGPLRNVAVIAAALIVWSAVLVMAERRARQNRDERALGVRDAIVMGVMQCFALIPGVSRSGATISGGLFRGIDRVSATRLSFFLAIPALTAATVLELPKALGNGVGVGKTLVGTAIAFVVAYASVAWLLRFVAGHKITWFVPYRIAAGVVIFILLAVGTL
ncbi:MAG TPA: undecaprenyl-diphosphate phosphatase [Frankiaceae bacterium]|nr:undecaprenyl-diphosphate phosphatase [Frankiaceae bacterium]